ncbi:transcription factor Maf-like [Frankliniella occidentalis]|uniref:Transcription factor Maf-like n=1 Tax=Frankliniella occidentalis TaxID=133901 RepID=A0A6J1TKD2_FRAOC|nr:transcription factor Maf-like [Frankliniella occidentalis]
MTNQPTEHTPEPGTPLQEVSPHDMEPEALTDAYVEEFVLDHLDVSVKRENPNLGASPAGDDAQRRRPPTIRLPSMAGAIVSMQQLQLQQQQQQQQQQSPPHQLLTPPSHPEPMYHHMGLMPMQPHAAMVQHTGGVLVSAMKTSIAAYAPHAPPDTSTPPATPSPGRTSPGLPASQSPPSHYALDPEHHPHIQQLRVGGAGGPAGQPPSLMDEMAWLPNSMRQEPLDFRTSTSSRPDGEPGPGGPMQQDMTWGVPGPQGPQGAALHHQGHTSVIAGMSPSKQGILRMHHEYLHAPPHHPQHVHDDMRDMAMSPGPMGHPRPMSCSGSVISPPSNRSYSQHLGSIGDDIISDEQLMSLTVRELNKKLHGYPRDEVVRLKQKRRTLKNRGYAQNCRSKRMHQRHELENTNRALVSQVRRLEMDLARMTQERDRYRAQAAGTSPEYPPYHHQ